MKAAVVGSGAWGTALAIRLQENGHDVTMWTFETDLIEEMVSTRRNPRLPGATLPESFDMVKSQKEIILFLLSHQLVK